MGIRKEAWLNTSLNVLKYNGDERITITDALVILVYTVIAFLSLWQYKYGLSDHSIVIPFVKNFVNEKLYSYDYIMPEKGYFFTYLWEVVGLIIKRYNFDILKLFFWCYFVSIYMFFFSFYMVAVTLFNKKSVATLSLFFLLIAARNHLGGVDIFDPRFYTRVAAAPILLGSLYFFFNKKYFASFVLQGVGFLVHPLSASYVIAMLFISSVFSLKRIGAKRFFLCIMILVVLISPLLIRKILHPAPSLGVFHADPQWIKLLRLRSTHHIFPFSWEAGKFLKTCILLFAFLVSWKYKPKLDKHRIVLYCVATIFTLCLIGTIFTEFIPVSMVVQFQLFRSLRFFTFFAVMYFANYCFNEVRSRNNIYHKAAITILPICVFSNYSGTAVAGFFVLSAIVMLYHFIYQKEFLSSKYFVLVLVMITIVVGSNNYSLQRRSFSIGNAQEKDWLNAQAWAKKNTNLQDMFIVPPDREGFRVESERAIYGDWKDGTQMLFNPDFGNEWFRRMKALGYKKSKPLKKGFKDLNESDFIAIKNEEAGDGRKTFLVMYKDRDILNFPIVHENEKFVIYEVEK